MNVFMFCNIQDTDGSTKVIGMFKPFWLVGTKCKLVPSYSHKVYEMLGDYGLYSPVLFEKL